MPRIRRTTTIAAPLDKVFDFIADPEHLPRIWPSLLSVSNVERRADGATSFDWIYKMAGEKFQGRSEPVDFVRNERQVTRSVRGIPNTFHWLFAAKGATTEVSLDVEYDVPLLNWLVGKLNEREAETLLRNLKQTMEAVPAPADAPDHRPSAPR
jgi:uncharacterized membrane protein